MELLSFGPIFTVLAISATGIWVGYNLGKKNSAKAIIETNQYKLLKEYAIFCAVSATKTEVFETKQNIWRESRNAFDALYAMERSKIYDRPL